MGNLLDYIHDSQFDSFYDKPLNDVDILALTELAYLPFEDLVPYAFRHENGVRMDQLARLFLEKWGSSIPPLTMITKERQALLTALATSNRFKYIKVFGYVNDYDLALQKQFSAVTYALHRKEFITVFRGTDDTLIGWKEDFHMAYMREIPAQQAARGYLTKLMTQEVGRYHLAGHSKGGNLALFAASQLPAAYQAGLLRICTFDSPGFHPDLLETTGFQQVLPKLHSYLPQDSLVGILLHMPDQAVIIKSRLFGLLQHSSFTWEVAEGQFVTLDKRTSDSLQHDLTFKRWLETQTEEELKDFIDTLFEVFISAGIERFADLTIQPKEKLQTIQHNLTAVPLEQQEMVRRLLKTWRQTRLQVWKETHFPKDRFRPKQDDTERNTASSDQRINEDD